MSIEDSAMLAAWAILFVVMVAVAPRFRGSFRLARPEPQPLLLDPPGFEFDGPVIDLELA